MRARILHVLITRSAPITKPSLCRFLQFPITRSSFPSLRSLFSQCTCLNVRDQVSHPYKTTGKIIHGGSVHRNLCIFMANWKTKDSASSDTKHCLTSTCSSFLRACNSHVSVLFASVLALTQFQTVYCLP